MLFQCVPKYISLPYYYYFFFVNFVEYSIRKSEINKIAFGIFKIFYTLKMSSDLRSIT